MSDENLLTKLGLRAGGGRKSFVKPLVLTLLAVLVGGGVYLAAYLHKGQVTRTLTFYSMDTGKNVKEKRIFPRLQTDALAMQPEAAEKTELKIRQYIEDALLGSALPNSLPLFPLKTDLQSFMFRGGIVYADLSESAAFYTDNADSAKPGFQTVTPYRSLSVLSAGLKKNFRAVKEVRIFINCTEVI